ncbi:MAG: chromosomal replication initiator protein DnaA [Clostridia bacterium]|nr:chromosomal replication initiator protein DnaA [Clostridia bacterium]
MSYLDELSNIWEAVKLSFREQYSETIISLWFQDLRVHSYEDHIITLATDYEFKYSFVKEHYMDAIRDGFSAQFGFTPEVRLIFTGTPSDPKKLIRQLKENSPKAYRPKAEDGKEPKEAKETEAKKPFNGIFPQNYNFEYTFDNFIVGNSNKFAHAACTAVAARPATDYNPLFIYGPSGLGKTHLMSAVVNEIKRKKPDTRVVYIKGDDFTNEMIESLSRQEMNKFHNKYRNCDILLIDDIQFIAGKNSTQEEFFHTFNTLYEDRKQIVLSSDRPPKDIQTLEERLKTRFEWGLIADIQPPDLELRIAIIKKKAEQVNIVIPDEVLTFLAENLRSNIRQIEGAIKKLSAVCFLTGKSITMEVASSCLSELLGGAEPINVTVDKIFSAVYRKYNVGKEELLGNKRTREIANARHLTIYLIRNITEMSLPNIGKIFNRDHSTIISSCAIIEKKLNLDSMFKIELDDLIQEITG